MAVRASSSQPSAITAEMKIFALVDTTVPVLSQNSDYFSPFPLVLPHTTLLPQTTLVPQLLLLPQTTLLPHTTLVPFTRTVLPQTTLLPQTTFVPHISLLFVTSEACCVRGLNRTLGDAALPFATSGFDSPA